MAGLSIGEFARESGLTQKALRLYDELRLLPPADVDPRSGYRSYDRDQLEKARLVAWLRGLGMPLARIRVVVDLPPQAAAAEIATYWRQVEADTAARRQVADLLIDQLSRKDSEMTDGSTQLQLRSAAHTDAGLVRESNEDALYAGARLFAVADGFGGQDWPSSASVAAIGALETSDVDTPAANLLKVLGSAAEGAGTAVRRSGESDSAPLDSGTTLTAMLWSGRHFALAHVGDSRGYLLRGGELSRLTHDHTYVQSLVDEDKITLAEAASHPQRTQLVRALHRDDTGAADLHLREAQPGDRYLLCSDGVHSVLRDEQLQQVLVTTAGAQDAVDELTRLVHEAGAPDNLAHVVIDASAPPDGSA